MKAEDLMTQNGNAALWFVDRHIDEGRENCTAFVEATGAKRRLTYGQLAHQSGQVAGALRRAGLKQEDRVACIVLDQIEYPALFWGALRAGVVPVLLNTLLGSEIYDVILRDARASALIVSAELWPVVGPVVANQPDLKQVIIIGDGPADIQSWDDFITGAPAAPMAQVTSDDCAFWLYSSGSTGRPKGVRHVHSALRATADTYGAQVLGIQQGDIIFSAAKIFFAYGLGNAMTFPMAVGATSVLFNGRPTPDVALQIISETGATIFCGVPTLYAAMVAQIEQAKMPAHSLRLCISAGEALPAEVGHSWSRLTEVEILDGVGSTEMLHIFLSNHPNDIVYGTSGRAVPGYELKCLTEDGRQIVPGEVGEMLVRGESAAEGYWNQRAKSRTTFEGEWTRTGDKYEILDDGRYVYCGRTDDMFKVSGIWVSPFEVEQALVTHPAVLEAAVVSARDGDGLEKPKAYVVLKAEAADDLADALKSLVQDRIGKWKYPRWIEIVSDLPKTATGKIQRFKLRDMQ
jgi:4-hydroxybenzoate-CoA ligase